MDYSKELDQIEKNTVELSQTLSEHVRDFATWREEWREHRLHAAEAMKKVSTMHDTIAMFAGHVRHLDTLPTIANGISGLHSKAIKYVAYLVFGTMFILALIVCVLLMRDSIKDFKIPGWVEITTPNTEDK